mgnify:CR=1 FL=1
MRRLHRPLAVLTVACAVAGSCSYSSRVVTPPEADEIESSTLYAADGTLIYTFHAEENRKVVPLDEIPAHVRDAVVAIEDERFYRHTGVDVRGVLRALRVNAEEGAVTQGGSTITQQYVKQELLDDDSRTVSRKVQEASMAIQLERRYSKDRILELYLNAIYFGNGAYGIEAAAHQYFGRTAQELDVAQGALLAGLIQRPGATNPFRSPDVALERRQLVLERMRANGMLGDDELTWWSAQPLRLASGVVPAAERYPAAYFVEEVKQWILDDPRFGATAKERRDLLFGGGLRIQTTVDLEAQAHAEAAVAEVLPDPAGPSAALVAIEPATGFVRAMVGGRDFFGTGPNDKFNLATQKGRPGGSSFKPFVLAAALEQGVDPYRKRLPAPACVTIPLPGEDWRPCNAESGGAGNPTIAEGTVSSYNTLYAQLVMEVGPQEAVDTAARLGVRSPLQPNPAAVLGTNDVTALDMASAYATFADRGIHVRPVLVTKITRADGTILFEHRHTQEKAMDAGLADQVSDILQDAVERGTGRRAQIDRPVAGKTGTGQDYKDAWFVGYTPQLSTAVWVGFAERQVSMQPPATPIRVFGGTYPAQIWQRFMSQALAGRPVVEFTPPTTTTTTPRAGGGTVGGQLGPLVAVPDVRGLDVQDAIDVLSYVGLEALVAPAEGSDEPPGVVVVQAPLGGSAPQGSVVTLEVS